MDIVPVILEGSAVRLEPLERSHIPALAEVGSDPDLWRLTIGGGDTLAAMTAYVEAALAEQAAGSAVPFVTVDTASGRIAGSTRFANISVPNRRAEIGWTWLGRPWQRSAVNTEAKYLMLRHAFETWRCHRVELKTNALNARSRAAILRIGATEEGTLRQHMVNRDGTLRDTVYFSILDREWPAVRARLERLMHSRDRASTPNDFSPA